MNIKQKSLCNFYKTTCKFIMILSLVSSILVRKVALKEAQTDDVFLTSSFFIFKTRIKNKLVILKTKL